MAIVFYKFRSSKDFHSLPIDGTFISVSDFKTRIFASARYGHGRDFDLLISDAQTDQEYADDSHLITRNSSLLVRRIPGLPQLPIVVGGEKPKAENNPPSSVVKDSQKEKEGGFDSHDFGPDFGSVPMTLHATPLPSNTHCQEGKVEDGFKTLNPVKRFGKDQTPPQGYVCRRCKVAGHYIQHCPTNGDPNYDFQRVQASSANSRASTSSVSSCVTSVGDNTILPELYCPLCKKLMRDAALTKCCFRSFCDHCIRNHIVSKSGCVCQRKIVGDDIVPNQTLRDTISRIMNQSSGDRSSNNGGTSSSVQDTASAAAKAKEQRENTAPAVLHDSEKVNKEPKIKKKHPAGCGKTRATK